MFYWAELGTVWEASHTLPHQCGSFMSLWTSRTWNWKGSSSNCPHNIESMKLFKLLQLLHYVQLISLELGRNCNPSPHFNVLQLLWGLDAAVWPWKFSPLALYVLFVSYSDVWRSFTTASTLLRSQHWAIARMDSERLLEFPELLPWRLTLWPWVGLEPGFLALMRWW